MTAQQRVMMVLLPVFLALYVLPVWIGGAATFAGALTGETGVGRWFFYVLTEPDDPMALMQRLILPLTAGVTVVALWSPKAVWYVLTLIGMTLLAMVSVAAIWWFLIVPDNALNLFGPTPQVGDNPVDTIEEFDRIAQTYLIGHFEALAAYLAVLFGLAAKKE